MPYRPEIRGPDWPAERGTSRGGPDDAASLAGHPPLSGGDNHRILCRRAGVRQAGVNATATGGSGADGGILLAMPKRVKVDCPDFLPKRAPQPSLTFVETPSWR